MPTLRGQLFAIAELLLGLHWYRQSLSESESEEFVWVLLLGRLEVNSGITAVGRFEGIDSLRLY